MVSIDWLTGWLALCDRIKPGGIRIMSDRVPIVFRSLMRFGDSGLRSIIALGDYLNL